MKLADSSIGYNPRMMGVRFDGMLVYFTEVITDVETGKIDRIRITPKAGVYIQHVTSIQKNLNPKNQLEMVITFPKN